jgi:hypothetical protein
VSDPLIDGLSTLSCEVLVIGTGVGGASAAVGGGRCAGTMQTPVLLARSGLHRNVAAASSSTRRSGY